MSEAASSSFWNIIPASKSPLQFPIANYPCLSLRSSGTPPVNSPQTHFAGNWLLETGFAYSHISPASILNIPCGTTHENLVTPADVLPPFGAM